ncbi:hypothetical protein MMC07_006791 [Pseudocyphellaria aurata]|nr:hypothetical protein [Pseudocyphellaria aurata]
MDQFSYTPPLTKEDSSMIDYFSRTAELRGSEKMFIKTDFQPILKDIKELKKDNQELKKDNQELKKDMHEMKGILKLIMDEVVDLRAKDSARVRETSVHNDRIFVLEDEISVHKDRIIVLEDEISVDKDEISVLKEELSVIEQSRITAFGANLIAKFLDMEEKTGRSAGTTTSSDDVSSNSPSHATTRYVRAAENFDDSKFAKTGLPGQCFKLLKKYRQMIEQRNIYAHETEQAFAKLLLKDEHKQELYLWGPYLTYCFKKSVEEIASEPQKHPLYSELPKEEEGASR